ncbi:MAG: hypothetical protein NC489_29095 [Ruminococcus flavefaciens]|nr:hypothetical protein [Ruminococcus flavefaciens]
MARTKGAIGKDGRYKISRMIKKIREYTKQADLPILKECCVQNEWDYDYFIQLQREHEDLCRESRRLLAIKEIKLEKAMYTGSNVTAMIFGLKQLGWKDNPEPIVVNNTIQNNMGGNRSDKLKQCSKETLEELDEILNEIDEESESV